MATLKEMFQEAVKAAIGEDRNHGWGVDDSCEVIETLIAEEMGEGKVPSEELMRFIKMVVNPSAFRQKLEETKRPDGLSVLAKSEKKRAEKEVFSLYQ